MSKHLHTATIIKNRLTPYEKAAAIDMLRLVSGMSGDDAYAVVTGMISGPKSCWAVPVDEELLENNMEFYKFFQITDLLDPNEDGNADNADNADNAGDVAPLGVKANESTPFDDADIALRTLIASLISRNELERAIATIRLLSELQTIQKNVW